MQAVCEHAWARVHIRVLCVKVTVCGHTNAVCVSVGARTPVLCGHVRVCAHVRVMCGCAHPRAP